MPIRLVLMAMLAFSACAPVPDSGATVSLEPMTPQARSARDSALQGSAAPGSPVTPSSLTDDATYTGGPVIVAAEGPRVQTYEVVAPAPLPTRPASSGPSVVGFALDTTHPVGTTVYSRPNASAERAARACDRYASGDLAQAAFLRTGGPQTDSQGVDPDGDGYACDWDPTPFRNAIR
jgi:hypothetical protein